MNTGAFGENFPYSNFHDLNMDWIIKIAKDFLDQYTNIQNTITEGLTNIDEATEQSLADLQEKYDTLEGLLNTWYNTHSEDIANELASAIADINALLVTTVGSFQQQASQIAQQTIASIPTDYTELYNMAHETAEETEDVIWDLAQCAIRNRIDTSLFVEGYYNHNNTTIGHGGNTKYLPPIRIRKGLTYSFRQVYGYFCTIVYDDESVVSLANSATPATINYGLTATKNGYAYVTINTGYYDTAMVVEGYANYNGAYFTGYGSVLKSFSVNSIHANNYSNYLPNIASSQANTIYKLIITNAMTVNGTMTDVPDILKDGHEHVSILMTIGATSSIPCTQILITDNGELYRRHVSNENPVTFTDWVSIATDAFHNIQRVISPNNYGTLLPSLESNDLVGKIYTFISTKNMTTKYGGLWSKVPPELEKQQCIGSIMTYGRPGYVGCTQIMYIANLGKTYMRYFNDSGSQTYWTNWITYDNNEIHIAKDGTGDFSTLTEGLAYATSIPNCHVYVHEGTYDIIEEYTSIYGADFFLNYSQSETNIGIVLSNNVIVECYPNVYIRCEYTGSNEYVQNKFSPFNSGIYGFTLINANIISKKVRYAIHDERGGTTDYYHNTYLNCNINHDKSGGAGFIQCIGGGLGKNGLIDIENCIFQNPTSTGNIVSWHNARAANAKSKLNIKNCYIQGGVRFSYWGESTKKSTMIVTGCRMLTDAVVTQETQEYSTVNVEIIQWGNTTGAFQ